MPAIDKQLQKLSLYDYGSTSSANPVVINNDPGIYDIYVHNSGASAGNVSLAVEDSAGSGFIQLIGSFGPAGSAFIQNLYVETIRINVAVTDVANYWIVKKS